MADDMIGITDIVKHKVYRASWMGWGEVKKMDRAWCI